MSQHSLNHQRGAIGIWGILSLLLGFLCLALVVDSSRLWLQQRQLQRVADMAAIDAAQNLNCASTLTDVQTAAQNAAVRNGYFGSLSVAPNEVQIGALNTSSGLRKFTANSGHEAVRVYATWQVPSSLVVGGLFGGQITLHAQAVARSRASLVSFDISTYALTLNSSDANLSNLLFSKMLGGNVNLSLLSYQGIADTQLSLLTLIKASATAGGVNELLNTELPVVDMLALLQNAAAQQGASTSTITALQTLINQTTNTKEIRLADLLDVSTIDLDSAAKVGLNLFSLLTSAATVANGNNALNLPLAINVPPLTSINSQIKIIEPPKLVIGPAGSTGGGYCTWVKSAAIETKTALQVSLVGLAKIDLALNLDVAQGLAGLNSVHNDGSSTIVKIDATPGIASITLTNNAETGPAEINALLGIVKLAKIGLNLPLQPPSAQTLTFNIAHPAADNLPQTQSISSPLGGSLANVLSQQSALDIDILGIHLPVIDTVVNIIVSPLLGQIGSVLLDPLLKMLGIQIGGMSVTVDGLQDHDLSPLVI